MATESLIVEIDARTTKLESALKKAGVALDDVDCKTGKADSSLKKFTGVASAAGAGIATLTKGAIALGAALTTTIVLSAKAEQELAQLSAQAKLSAEDFEALSFATKQYGIDAEGIADISKDISDKLGEYSSAGTGAFQDFADVMGLSAEEAKATAVEFESLSSDQVIGEMVSRMEDANLTTNQMTFALESMGNDLSKLTPLFSNNSKELNTLTARYNNLTAQLNLTKEEAEGLQGAATSFDLLTSSLGKGVTLISSQLAPALDEFFNGVIDVVPTATQAIVNFINSFKTPEEITNLVSVQEQIKDVTGELTEESEELLKVQKRLEESDSNRERNALSRMLSERKVAVTELTEELSKLKDRESELTAQRVADAEKLSGGEISANTGTANNTGGTGSGDQVKEIEDRFKTETKLLTEQLEKDLAIIGKNKELKKELEAQYQLDLSEIQKGKYAETYDQELLALTNNYTESLALAGEDKDKQLELHEQFLATKKQLDMEYADSVIQSGQEIAESAEDNANAEIKLRKAVATEGISNAASLASSALSLASIAFEDNKAIQYAMTGINTASGIMNQYASGDGLSAFARASAVAATGIAQLAAIKSSTSGSTTVASVSSTSPTVTEEEETDTINLDSQDTSGTSTNFVLTINANGDDITEAIANNMTIMQVDGTLG